MKFVKEKAKYLSPEQDLILNVYRPGGLLGSIIKVGDAVQFITSQEISLTYQELVKIALEIKKYRNFKPKNS